jgi:UDP-N-acetylmuramoyl-tripeptide--D-alanyl-D-alanine ligase
MRQIIKKAIIKILAACARLTMRLKKPLVIGVTGSVGKTTTKEAIAAALSPYFEVGKSEGNFNSEYGLPCQICGMKWSFNPLVWLANFFWAWPRKLIKFPKVLVLEMGSDKPGDIAHLTSIAPPNIAVICAIGVAHLEKFGSKEALFEEKSLIFDKLPQDGLAIANLDDEGARRAYEKFSGKKMSYGIESNADVVARDITKIGDRTQFCVRFQENADLAVLPFFGKPSVLSALCAYAVGISLGLSLQKITAGLANWKPTPGRMNVYSIGEVLVLDDSYNANPQSVKSALETLAEMPGKKWAVLGDMLELGPMEREGHLECLKSALKLADKVILVGECYHRVLREWFPGSESAAIRVRDEVRPGDTVLVKGSKKMQMYKVIDGLKEAHV